MSRVLRNLPKSAANAPLASGKGRPDQVLHAPADPRPLVLLAISGGGSRSAYYAACVMEQLARIPASSNPADGSLLDRVRVISTVSGGGLPAAYYVTHFSERRQPDFFEKFKKTMSVNLQWRTYGHMVTFPPLALGLLRPSVTRTDLLAEEMERVLECGSVTFDDLLAAETRPVDPVPTLIVNGTVYNSGQRLAFTNLPGKRFPSLVATGGARIALGSRDRAILHHLVQPLTFEDFGSDIGTFPLSRALAASAAYPMVLAPIALKTYPEAVPSLDTATSLSQRAVNTPLLESPVLYVADGGLHENEGIDSLLSLIRTLPPTQPVLLIAIDGTARMETLKLGAGKIWGFPSVISRMYDIGNLRPLAFYGTVAAQFHDPDHLRAVVIRMEGYDPETDRMLQNIPTMFKLSNRHRLALQTAAIQNVAHMLENLQLAYAELTHGAPRAARAEETLSTPKKPPPRHAKKTAPRGTKKTAAPARPKSPHSAAAAAPRPRASSEALIALPTRKSH